MKKLALVLALVATSATAGQLEDNLQKVGQVKFINEKCGYSNAMVIALENNLNRGNLESQIKQSIPAGYRGAKAISSNITCGASMRAHSNSINEYVKRINLLMGY